MAPREDRRSHALGVPVEPHARLVEAHDADVAFDDPPPRSRCVVAGDPRVERHPAPAHDVDGVVHDGGQQCSLAASASNLFTPLWVMPEAPHSMALPEPGRWLMEFGLAVLTRRSRRYAEGRVRSPEHRRGHADGRGEALLHTELRPLRGWDKG